MQNFSGIARWIGVLVLFLPASSFASVFEYEFRAYDGSNLICSPVIAEAFSDSLPAQGATTTERPWDVVGAGTASYEAIAGRGFVGSRVDAWVFVNSGFNLTYGGCAVVRTLIDDIVVSGPAGAATAELTVDVRGSSSGDSPNSLQPISFAVTIRSYSSGGSIRDISAGTLQPAAPGLVDTTLSSGVIDVEAGDRLEVELKITTQNALSVSPGPGTKSANLDFHDGSPAFGMSFPATGPVFALSAGYTVDSVDGAIVDNQWQIGAVDVPALNGAGHLSLVGALAVLACRQIQRRSRSCR